MELTQTLLKDHLSYDPQTGEFMWVLPTGRRGVVGTLAGSAHVSGYVHIQILGRQYKAHRLAFLHMTGKWPSEEVDHINGDRANNKWSNLRESTRTGNNQNRPMHRRNTSGVKGVSFDKKYQKWGVKVCVNSKQINLGYYDDLELADLVATEARNKYHGAYAKHV